jgi:diaminopimelate epimerase
MQLAFSKYHGLGNDFLIVEGRALSAAQAARLCDRHLGVGGDGVLLLSGEHGRYRMQVINADGSAPEMCGNGIRCVALHLARTGRAALNDRFEIDTDAGPHGIRVLSAGESGVVEVSMRAPNLSPREVPIVGDAPMIDAELNIAGRTLHVTAVTMGNPHAVVFDEVRENDRLLLAPIVQAHPLFPHAANVGFARLVDERHVELAVYERGAGWTQACGTGACAAAVAAVETGRARRGEAIEVVLPGGPLTIVVGGVGQRLMMTGPTVHVFDGVVVG